MGFGRLPKHDNVAVPDQTPGGSAVSSAPNAATNIERLKKNLPEGSLAVQLVKVYESTKPEERQEALKKLLQDRLDQVRASLESPKA